MTIYYEDFDYSEHKEPFSYDVPFEKQMEAIREYFDREMINLDGKDNDIYNVFSTLGCLDDILDEMEEWLTEECKEDAFEAYKEYIDWYYDED